MDMNWIVNLLSAAIISGTPLLLATLGEMITEQSGSQNLGVEGMMYMGAVIGFSVGLGTGNPLLAVIGAMSAGVLGAMIFGFLTITLRANQIVTGLTLTLFGTGFASFVGSGMVGTQAPQSILKAFSPKAIPLLSRIPFFGDVLFNHDVLVYITFLFVFAASAYLYKTRRGLNGRMVGENPGAADALGISVTSYRYIHLVMGGALCGLAGGYLSLAYVPSWQDGLVAGRGWIAVALIIFSKWNPMRAILAAYFFGGLGILGLRLQMFELPLSQYVLDAVPYLMTILVLILNSIRHQSSDGAPQALGQSYFREER